MLDHFTLNENEIVSCSEQAIWSSESWEFDFNTMLCWKRTHSVWCYCLLYECLQFVELMQCNTTVCRMGKCLMGHLKLQIGITAKLLTFDGPFLWASNLQSFGGCWRSNETKSRKQCFWTTDVWWFYWCSFGGKEYHQARSNYYSSIPTACHVTRAFPQDQQLYQWWIFGHELPSWDKARSLAHHSWFDSISFVGVHA